MTAMDILMRAAVAAFAPVAASDTIGIAVRRMTAATLCAALAAAFAAASAGCAVAALWIFALPHVGPVGAPLITAAALLSVCLALLAIVRRIARRPPARVNAIPESGADARALLIAEGLRLLETNKGAALLAALCAGAAAARPNRR